MIKDYGLFYSYKDNGDVLSIKMDDSKLSTNFERRGNVVIIYHNEEIIGYNIFDISKIVKIKTAGMISLPSSIFIDIINSILRNAKAECLEYKADSGFVIGKVISSKEVNNKYVISLDLSNYVAYACSEENIENGQLIVIAKEGTFLPNGTKIIVEEFMSFAIDAHICKENELGLSDENKIIYVENDGNIGSDFFQMEEK